MTDDTDEPAVCRRCGGTGVEYVYYGNLGGSISCTLCDGSGKTPQIEVL